MASGAPWSGDGLGKPAVDLDHLAGDVGREVGCQEDGGLRDLAGFGPAAKPDTGALGHAVADRLAGGALLGRHRVVPADPALGEGHPGEIALTRTWRAAPSLAR